MPYIGRHLDRGNYLKLDDISSSFDGVETTFNLTNGGSPFYPGSAFSILVVLAGVIQEAESAYQIDQSQITFASAPLASDSFFCIVLGTALGINVPGNGTVGGTQLTKPFSYDGFFYLNDTTNRVGINSSSPTTALDVQGTVTATEFVGNLSNTSGISTFYNLTVENDLTVNGSFSTLDTIVTEVDKLEVGANNSTVGVAITQSGSGDILRLYDSSTQVVTVADGGNVGIGTNNPTVNLEIGTPSDGNTFFKMNSSSAAFLQLSSTGTRANIIAGRTSGNSDLTFMTSSGGTNYERMRIENDGNVGIGTDDPSWGVSTGLIVGDGASAKGITLFSNSANVGDLAFADATSGTARYRGLIRYDHSDDSLAFRTNSTERLRIDSSGNVGIGTDNPNSKIQLVAGNSVAADNGNIVTISSGDGTSGNLVNKLNFGVSSTNNYAWIQSVKPGTNVYPLLLNPLRGNIGIGTDNPSSVLSINSSQPIITLTDSDNGLSATINGSSGNLYYDTATVARDHIFRGSTTEVARITGDGLVGINTTSPADTLDVNGNVLPSFDATHDLGSASKRWNNVYTTDLQLSNEGSSNDVDGSWGRWTIQEGEDDLFLINRRNGKKYKFVLQEVN